MVRSRFSHSTQDEYYTPTYAVALLEPYIFRFKTIWCPFDTEDSNYVKYYRQLGYKVIATHIDAGQDFLSFTPDFKFDVIISNPPFSLKNEILEKCYQYKKPFALLLPFTMFNSIKTIGILNRNKDEVQFMIMDKRISFNGERPNFTCWYVCKDVLPQQIVSHIFEDDPRQLHLIEGSV